MKSQRIIITLFIVATCLAAPFAQADGFDGSRPLLCATMSAIECVDGKGCENSHPKDLDLPQFLRIDFAANQITTVRAGGEQRVAKISSISDHNPTLVIQGVQEAMGWTISISKSVGNMSATVMDREFVAVVFGACMPEK
jgi:hypothetical protein